MQSTLRWFGAGVLVALLAFHSHGEGETDSPERRNILGVFSSNVVAAHFADGQNWTTEFVFMNMDDTHEKAALRFLDSEGRLQEVDLKGLGRRSGIEFTLPPYGSLRLDTVGGGGRLTQGYAVLDPEDRFDNRIGSTAIFRRQLPGIPTYEASVPFGSRFERKAYFPFDHRNGFTSGVAFVNLSESFNYFERLLLEFYGEDGALMGTSTLTLPGGHHTAFSLTTAFPDLDNQVGMMVVTIEDPGELVLQGFQLLGFRFNPDGPFTTISPMISIDESLEL